MGEEEFDAIVDKARNDNPWFTPGSIACALNSIKNLLSSEELTRWLQSYPEPRQLRKIALVMAGNIPLVGFHDLLCVLISGHTAVVKLSSKDRYLVSYIIEKLLNIEPGFSSRIIVAEQLKGFDAVIATGSDNSARYFDYYFGKYPHIIRRNRTSVAVITGDESSEEFFELGKDVFTYFGLGCRNVAKLYVPRQYSFTALLDVWSSYQDIINHHKYCNNYDYQKSILLVNRDNFLDNGFVLLKQSEALVSPISVVYFEEYTSSNDLQEKIGKAQEKIQVIVGRGPVGEIAFGSAQTPGLSDYADKVDTMKFLTAF